jgi:Tfp pilus assembly protein FimT
VRRDARAVTLVELVAVLAVVAVAVSLVLPAIGRGVETVRLRSEGGRVAALLREARQRAVSTRRPTRVTLDAARNAVTLAWEDDGQVVRALEVASGIRLSAATGRETLTFSPRGITQPARWRVEGAASRRLLIEVHGVTGRVVVGAGSS